MTRAEIIMVISAIACCVSGLFLVLTLSFVAAPKARTYDCRQVEITPDVPAGVREQCRRTMGASA